MTSVALKHQIDDQDCTPQRCDMNLGTWVGKGVRIFPRDGEITLVTKNGNYTLKKHATMNLYCGVCGGHKVRVVLRPMVGEVTWW